MIDRADRASASKSMVDRRVAILVVGMHRSGTSAFTRVLNLLGASLPKNLIPAVAGDNDTGFWESHDIARLNDAILDSQGSSWQDWRVGPPSWLSSPVVTEFQSRALALLHRDFASSPLFVIKDPRICRLLPFWLEVLAAFDAEIKCILPLRNPLEVAASLQKRNNFSPAYSQLLWLRYVIDAERNSRGLPRVVIEYGNLLSHWRAVASRISDALDLAWPRRSAAAEVEIDRFLAPEMRHHRTDDGRFLSDVEAGVWVRDTYRALCDLAKHGESPPALARIDAIAEELDHATQALGVQSRAEELARETSDEERRKLEERLKQEEHKLAELRAQSEGNTTKLQRIIDERGAHIAMLKKTLGERERYIDELQNRTAAEGARVNQLERLLAAQEDQVAALNKDVELHRGQVVELERLVAEREHQAAELSEDVELRDRRLDQLEGLVAELSSDVQARDRRIAGLETSITEHAAILRTAHKTSDELKSRGEHLERRNAELKSRLRALERIRSSRDQLVTRLNAIQCSAFWQFARPFTWVEQRWPWVARGLAALPKLFYWTVTMRLPRHLVRRREAREVLASGLFDGQWYVEKYPEVAIEGWNPLNHFLEIGAREGFSPGPEFDSAAYLVRNPDVAQAKVNPLLHYLRYGEAEGRARSVVAQSVAAERGAPPPRERVTASHSDRKVIEASGLFDAQWYRATYRDLPTTDADALDHFLARGAAEGRKPNPLFETTWYLKRYPDVVRAQANPLAHFIKRGAIEGRDPSPLFDTSWYLERNPEVGKAGINPLRHYLERGDAEGRRPNPLFDPGWYRDRYGAIAQGQTALAHYLGPGVKALRDPSPWFSTQYYHEANPDVALAGQNPLWHFLVTGDRDGRRCHPLIEASWVASQLPEPAAQTPVQALAALREGELISPHPAIAINSRLANQVTLTAVLDTRAPPLERPPLGAQLLFDGPGRVAGARERVTPERQDFDLGVLVSFARAIEAESRLLAQSLRAPHQVSRLYWTFDYQRQGRYLDRLSRVHRRVAHDAKESPLLSVIVPTHNRASIVGRAIDSLLRQTMSELEVLLVDDGSTDGTVRLIETRYDDPRLRLLQQPKRGVSAARNAGLEAATGGYIAYLDSDNYWEPYFAEVLVKALGLCSRREAVYGALRIFTDQGEVVYRGDRYERDALCAENYIDMNVFAHHRRFVDAGLRFDESLRRCVDWDFILRLTAGRGAAYLPVIGCNYYETQSDPGRITTDVAIGDYYRVCARNYNFARQVSGQEPHRTYRACLILPVYDGDARTTILVWRLFRYVVDRDLQLVLLAHRLPDKSARLLHELAERSSRVRVVHFPRFFYMFAGANIGVRFARGDRLVFLDPVVEPSETDLDELIERALDTAAPPILAPLVVGLPFNDVPQLATVSTSSYVIEPLAHLPDAGALGPSPKLVLNRFPVVVDPALFGALGGFAWEYAARLGLVDFCCRALEDDPKAIGIARDIRFMVSERTTAEDFFPRSERRESSLFEARWPRRGDALSGGESSGIRRIAFRVEDARVQAELATPQVPACARRRALQVTIRCPAPSGPERKWWGDFHYATAIRDALVSRGHQARIEMGDAWHAREAREDVVLHIRGIKDIKPVLGALNAMWIISHPNRVSDEELLACERIFAASQTLARFLGVNKGLHAHTLPQGTDSRRFRYTRHAPCPERARTALFVGNSRNQPRRIVMDAVAVGAPVSIFGNGWTAFLGETGVAGDFIPNEDLARWYGSARCVLNDHWPAMRELGIISNRLFDVVASGGIAITDPVEGLESMFGTSVKAYTTARELAELIDTVDSWAPAPEVRARRAAEIARDHSIDARVAELLHHI